MKYNNCEKKQYKDCSTQECSSDNYSSNNSCCCQSMMNTCSYPKIDYKDSVLSCGGSVTPSVSTITTTPVNLGTINVNSSCVKCPSTLLSYFGYVTIPADTTTTAGTTLTLTINKVCGFNSTPTPVAQVITTIPTITTAGLLPNNIPLSFQRCDSQMFNCCNNCCNSCCNNCCQYTLTATLNFTTAPSAALIITSNSLTAITSSSSCCCC